MDGKSIIHLQNIVKLFKVKNQDVLVLKGIDLEIKEGDFALIYGPSGCGKSTLLHVMLGLEPPTLGKAEVFGSDLYSAGEDGRAEVRKRGFGVVYQQQTWIRALSILENVSFPLSLQGVPKWKALDRAKEELRKVGLSDWVDYKPTELSAGQQQKAALAMSLVTDPKVIIADEPTGNLDHQSGVELMEHFAKLNQVGKTVIMVTHDLDNIKYASTIFQLFDGKLINTFQVNKENLVSIREQLVAEKDGSVSGKPGTDRSTLALARAGVLQTKGRIEPKDEEKKGWFSSLISAPIKLISFSLLLLLHLGHRAGSWFFNRKWVSRGPLAMPRPFFTRLYVKLYSLLERKNNNSISRQDLVDISLENMMAKRSRTMITIGGMAVAIGVIVFLISIGYGLERLVVSRVATLEEMKQLEVMPAVKSNIKITDESIAKLEAINGVEKVLPVISVAGNIEYQNSNADVVIYGVPSDYLSESSVSIVSGDIFGNEAESTVEEAVVNQSFLRLLGINESEAIGVKFRVSFVATEVTGTEAVTTEIAATEPVDDNVSAPQLEYEIVGVTSDTESAMAYVPLIGLKQLGNENYSQVKVVVAAQSLLSSVRKQVEALGFVTSAVSDTVTQVISLFATLRGGLWILGLVVLSVAGFGMFNTITVSLLERTREVGFMKALGMKSNEVQELFLTESMTMGFLGGILGIVLGIVGGKLLSLVISFYSTSRGFGFIDVTSIPFLFIVLVIVISAGVGVITGRFPARRAAKISALDALRYE